MGRKANKGKGWRNTQLSSEAFRLSWGLRDLSWITGRAGCVFKSWCLEGGSEIDEDTESETKALLSPLSKPAEKDE